MKRGRIPLTALRSFEVAGRLENFTFAAAELFVSQAAISRQVRDLETQLGTMLFIRHHRRVELTAAGKKLLSVLTKSFDEIDDCLSELTEKPETSELIVNVEPSFASCWLVPKLVGFRNKHPLIDVNVDSDSHLVDLRTHASEIVIRYSNVKKSWPRTESKHLFDVESIPVISPKLAEEGKAITKPSDLLQYTFLQEENRTIWDQWLANANVPDNETKRGPIYADGGLVMQAALAGQGVAIIDKTLAAAELKSGRLIQPFEQSVCHGAYWLVVRDFSKLSKHAAIFSQWILSNTGVIHNLTVRKKS